MDVELTVKVLVVFSQLLPHFAKEQLFLQLELCRVLV